MAGVKNIRNKISSVKNTQKITKAMEMVAAFKMRKTQDKKESSRHYAESIHTVIEHLILGNLEYKHPYLHHREVKRVGYIVVATDRGLAGSLNINLFKQLLAEMKKFNEKSIESKLVLIGTKAVSFFNSICKQSIIAQVTGMGDNPTLSKLIGPVKVMLQAYETGLIDKIYIVSNKFINTLSQIPQIFQILPLIQEETNKTKKMKSWDYLYEPDSKTLLDILINRYIESQVYQRVVENLASEQAARMVAMKAATDNSESLMNDLTLIYNKTRQTSITQELIEIISGASAV